MLAFQGAAVILLEDSGRTLVIGVHELAVDAIEYLILRAFSLDDLAECNLFRLLVDG